jgi:protein-tyrosine phosphatase
MTTFASAFVLAIVGAGRCGGQISMSCCPGRAASGVLLRVSQSQLERDVATIARWGAKVLVTLLEPAELAALPVDKLSGLAAAAKLAWYHLPLSIGTLPDAQFERLWSSASSRLQQIVRAGGKVSIHCRDGGDRTGLITARLLIELGCHPLDAINRVRAARPGMLGSAALADYLRRMQPSRLNAIAHLELLDRNGIVTVDPRTLLRRGHTAPCPVVRAETYRRDWSSQSRYQTGLLESRVMLHRQSEQARPQCRRLVYRSLISGKPRARGNPHHNHHRRLA